jgi:HPt (histidine-containing phosphotransfer) domain-containing protein
MFPAMNSVPNLDPAALQRLRRLGGDKFLREMIGLFLDYAAKKIAEATATAAAGNLEGVQKAIHPVKSSAGNVGASKVQALAAQMELQAKQGEASAVAASVADITEAFAAASAELKAMLPTLAETADPAPKT